jgi:hypothetical protein
MPAAALGLEQKVAYAEEILEACRRAKKMRWEKEDARRREETSEMYRYLKGLIERDRKRLVFIFLEYLPENFVGNWISLFYRSGKTWMLFMKFRYFKFYNV